MKGRSGSSWPTPAPTSGCSATWSWPGCGWSRPPAAARSLPTARPARRASFTGSTLRTSSPATSPRIAQQAALLRRLDDTTLTMPEAVLSVRVGALGQDAQVEDLSDASRKGIGSPLGARPRGCGVSFVGGSSPGRPSFDAPVGLLHTGAGRGRPRPPHVHQDAGTGGHLGLRANEPALLGHRLHAVLPFWDQRQELSSASPEARWATTRTGAASPCDGRGGGAVPSPAGQPGRAARCSWASRGTGRTGVTSTWRSRRTTTSCSPPSRGTSTRPRSLGTRTFTRIDALPRCRCTHPSSCTTPGRTSASWVAPPHPPAAPRPRPVDGDSVTTSVSSKGPRDLGAPLGSPVARGCRRWSRRVGQSTSRPVWAVPPAVQGHRAHRGSPSGVSTNGVAGQSCGAPATCAAWPPGPRAGAARGVPAARGGGMRQSISRRTVGSSGGASSASSASSQRLRAAPTATRSSNRARPTASQRVRFMTTPDHRSVPHCCGRAGHQTQRSPASGRGSRSKQRGALSP